MPEHFGFATLVANLIAPLLYSCRRIHEPETQCETRDDLLVQRVDSGADIAHRPAMLRVDHGLLPGLAAVTSQPRAIAKAAAGSAPEARFDRTAHAVSYRSRNPDARDISQ
jgi:hypothetical protein